MENEVMEVVANEGTKACSVMSKTCVIGKSLLITAAVGTAILISVKAIKKIKAKKAAKLEGKKPGEKKE